MSEGTAGDIKAGDGVMTQRDLFVMMARLAGPNKVEQAAKLEAHGIKRYGS